MQIIKDIFTWKTRQFRGKDDKLKSCFKHVISKLVYHSVDNVRRDICALIFSDGPNKIDPLLLGRWSYGVDEDLVTMCIREHIKQCNPDVTVKDQVPTTFPHVLIFKANMAVGDGLLYVFRQRTVNDVIGTNSADGPYEDFLETSNALKLCQGSDNVVALRDVVPKGYLQFYAVEHGESLLAFLYEHENQLTWTQILDIFLDITRAIDHCHSNNVLIRDIIPDNFIVVPMGNGRFKTKLASFLYAKCPSHEESRNREVEYIEDMNCLCFQGKLVVVFK